MNLGSIYFTFLIVILFHRFYYSSGGNKKLWNDLDVRHSHANVLLNAPIPHSIDPSRRLEIIPDVVHVFKSLVHGWINNKIIELPDTIIKRNGLSCSMVDVKHLTDLVRYEEECQLKMACGLKLEDVEFSRPMSSFDKMKVGNATKYVNHTVAASLRFYSDECGRKDVLTTAFFIQCVNDWFGLMTSNSSTCVESDE